MNFQFVKVPAYCFVVIVTIQKLMFLRWQKTPDDVFIQGPMFPSLSKYFCIASNVSIWIWLVD